MGRFKEMPSDHPDNEDLHQFADRKLVGNTLFRVAWHVFQCQECRSRLRELGPWAEERHQELFGRLEPSVSESAYRDVTRRVLDRVPGHEREHAARSRASPSDLFAELSSQPPARRRLLVENSVRFRSIGLVQVLLAESSDSWCDDPAIGEELARLALDVGERLEGYGHSTALLNDLRSEAWSSIANCRRILSDFEGAYSGLVRAEELRREGTGDVLADAVLWSLRASLFKDHRWFHQALRALERQFELHRESGDVLGTASALIKRSTVLRECGEIQPAIAILERAAGLIDERIEPRSSLLIEGNLAMCLRESGRGLEAREMLHRANRLGKGVAGRLDRLRLLWNQALIQHSAGELGPASSCFRTVCEEFAHRGHPFDAALVSLDLARLRLEEGRRSEAARLAREALPVFATRNIPRETRAALRLLHQATA